MFKNRLGTHIVCELRRCSYDILNNKEFLSKLLVDSATKGGATVLTHVDHQFTPQGVTILVLLAESHISIHTYPELGYAACDIFTCGTSVDTYSIFEEIEKHLGGDKYIISISRGVPSLFSIWINNIIFKIFKKLRRR